MKRQTSILLIVLAVLTACVKTPSLTTAATKMAVVPSITPLPSSVLQDLFMQESDGTKLFQDSRETNVFHSEITANSDCKHSGQYGIRLIADNKIDEDFWSSGENYWSLDFQGVPFAATKFTTLSFWVKGMSGGEKFGIGVFTGFGYELGFDSEKYVKVSQAQWQSVQIPLDKIDSKHLYISRIVFYFPKNEKGSICIDDVSFE